ncbi:hypothetical protein C8J57DRAFT_1334422 [Mycena rebaudengoi]|nr:hypothetical protein C8J57DRAFT_1334422 [Mycena rebaudengoi]
MRAIRHPLHHPSLFLRLPSLLSPSPPCCCGTYPPLYYGAVRPPPPSTNHTPPSTNRDRRRPPPTHLMHLRIRGLLRERLAPLPVVASRPAFGHVAVVFPAHDPALAPSRMLYVAAASAHASS